MQTVVGVFDTVNEAQDARDALLDSGFDASEMRLQSNPAEQPSDTLTTTDRTITGTTPRTEDEGFMAGIGRFFGDLFGSDDKEQAGHYSEAVRRGSTVLAVTVAEPDRVEQARSILSTAGAVDIDKRSESWREEGYSGFDPSAEPYHPDQIAAERSRYQSNSLQSSDDLMTPDGSRQVDQGTVLPVVREDLEVGKREVDLGTVRVFSRTETRPVEEQVQLHEERADIERRTVDRPATEADLKAFEGGSIEIHETSERPVVSKTARVVEEVVVGTEASTRTETVKEQLRNTVVNVDKGDAETTGMAEPDYRSHYQANQASLGGTYEEYEPAYRYGSTLRSDPRYANRSWDEVEADAHNDWTSRNPTGGSPWEKTKQAVRQGWESMTGRR
ncbi:YsnF/AvaK domain-containing protein [Polaromonas sp. CG_9.11]|uniref:YsnF/AvaK domain-containing protein n=1 Tax=Polaromonas sp. CG_9.11 TaxID=2787730 RepID=UPI0018CBD2B0|nr:YsnF/AvaK domain-containing protein [Polaromonas sp. CG_9.11]MBG6077917.1 stress response protein YsnF [Polaromonas sp. CG_9.11]